MHESRGRNEVGLDAHVDEPDRRGGGTGRVQRRQHEVTGDRRVGRDARGLRVAHLTDEDDVGVGAQGRTQRARERHARRVLIWICLTPSSRYSTGSSTDTMLLSRVLTDEISA